MRPAVLIIILASILQQVNARAADFDDVRTHPVCIVCGMDRQYYSYSRMVIDYTEGSVGFCSLHCAAADIAVNRQKTIRGLYAADFIGGKLVPVRKAFWVIGGDRSGVMTQRAKWAFEKEQDAQSFLRDQGGKPATFDDAVKATFDDMYGDIMMVRARKQERTDRNAR